MDLPWAIRFCACHSSESWTFFKWLSQERFLQWFYPHAPIIASLPAPFMKLWNKSSRLFLVSALIGLSISNIAPAAAAPTPAPTTAQEHLDAALLDINKAVASMRQAGTANRGGFVTKGRADLVQLVADFKAADDYLTAHPESNQMATGPVANESAALQPGPILRTAPGQKRLGTYNALNSSISDLNSAARSLVNNPAINFQGPVLGDLGGTREKILTDIVTAANDIRAAMDYADAPPHRRTQSGRSASRA